MHEPIKFQVSMLMKIMMNIFFGRGVAALNSLDSYQCYGGACCLHIQCKCEQDEQWGELHWESTGTRSWPAAVLVFQTETDFGKKDIRAQYLHWL
jgi:hypothetical protein